MRKTVNRGGRSSGICRGAGAGAQEGEELGVVCVAVRICGKEDRRGESQERVKMVPCQLGDGTGWREGPGARVCWAHAVTELWLWSRMAPYTATGKTVRVMLGV